MMSRLKSVRQVHAGTKQAIMQVLKRRGSLDAGDLARWLGVSAMGVRQHLYQLQRESLVEFRLEARPMGRPAKLWRLTSAANSLFPDSHAELTVGLIASLEEAFGADGLDKLLLIRARKQIESYQSQIPVRASLRRRTEILADIRTREGYMAEVLPQQDGSALLVENHCPICAAATACLGLCAAEQEVFEAVLGDGVEITRLEHIVSGARRCAYRIRKSPPRGRRTEN